MRATNLSKIMSKVGAKDLAVDPAGRILIRNPKLAELITAAAPKMAFDPVAFLDNCECTTNQKCGAK